MIERAVNQAIAEGYKHFDPSSGLELMPEEIMDRLKAWQEVLVVSPPESLKQGLVETNSILMVPKVIEC